MKARAKLEHSDDRFGDIKIEVELEAYEGLKGPELLAEVHEEVRRLLEVARGPFVFVVPGDADVGPIGLSEPGVAEILADVVGKVCLCLPMMSEHRGRWQKHPPGWECRRCGLFIPREWYSSVLPDPPPLWIDPVAASPVCECVPISLGDRGEWQDEPAGWACRRCSHFIPRERFPGHAPAILAKRHRLEAASQQRKQANDAE